MEVRDPIHGSVHILDEEVPILKHNFFKRLQNIKQLGFSDYVFPGATHTRYLHSIGVMQVAEKAFDRLFKDQLHNTEILRLKETLKIAALLHDIGHAPLSHSTETVMPPLEKLKLPSRFLSEEQNNNRQANHEDYTVKSIADSSLTESFSKVESKFGIDRFTVAELVLGETSDPAFFTLNNKNYFPLLHQLISSEMDCDRMDYLLRDSYFCGVSYGHHDLDWIIDNMEIAESENTAFLGINERAVSTFDHFLLSRFHMFLMVYFHYRSVCLEQMLFKYFRTSPDEYTIPADIEEYQIHDDHYLMKILRASSNNWAKRIVENEIPQKIFECFGNSELSKLEQLEDYLNSQNIEHLKGSSQGRLSKYYSDHQTTLTKFPVKVVKQYYGPNKLSQANINQVTDLFSKFSAVHTVNRIHCDFEQLPSHFKRNIMNIVNS